MEDNKIIGTIPNSYVDSMSYYEAITCINDYINDVLIQTINNNAVITDENTKKIIALNNKVKEIIEYYETHVIPTKVSELENDVGYITESDIPTKTSDLVNDSGYITKTVNDLSNYYNIDDIEGIVEDIYNTIPSKTSELENDSGYITEGDIPTKTSDLVNDSGYITEGDIPTKTSDLVNDSGYITEGDIPTKTSDLVNDSGYITKTVSDLTNYYNLDETEVIIEDIYKDIPTKVSELENDSGFTSNTGTITGITMNGSSKGTSGVVNLGTVITDISGKQDKLTTQTAYTSKGSATKVPQITTNSLGQVTGITEVTITQPTVNNATLTIQKNGTTVKTFTANASSNVTANITVPTALSGLTNDIFGVVSSSFADDYTMKNTTGTYELVPLSNTVQAGSNFTLSSNKIKCNRAGYVLVSARVTFQSLTNGLKWLALSKNTDTNYIANVNMTLSGRGTIDITPTLVQVAANDTIYLFVNGTKGDVLRRSVQYTNLTIQYVR